MVIFHIPAKIQQKQNSQYTLQIYSHDKVTQCDNDSTLNWKDRGSNPAGVFDQALESNLLTRLAVMTESNETKLSEAVSLSQ